MPTMFECGEPPDSEVVWRDGFTVFAYTFGFFLPRPNLKGITLYVRVRKELEDGETWYCLY